MSGPKAVRIVTVEEVREICRGALARLEAAVARWEKVGRRNDLVSKVDIQVMQQRSNEIHELLGKEHYLELQKQVPVEITWIESDMQRRIEKAARRAQDERTKARRRATLAMDFFNRAEQVDTKLDASVILDLKAIANRGSIETERAEAALSEALRAATAQPITETISEEHRACAERLSEGLKAQSIEGWLAQNEEPSEADLEEEKIEAAILDLSVAGAESDALALKARWVKLNENEYTNAARQMRADTLLVEISHAKTRQIEHQEKITGLKSAQAEAQTIPSFDECQLAVEVQEALDQDDAISASKLVHSLSDFIVAERKEAAAIARRAAVLAALSEVGYEVREGMQAATPDDGRLVLRRAANPQMGVEVAGGVAGERVQLRPVRFATAASVDDTDKDRDIETLWCSDFGQLREGLAALNATLTIERALPVGAAPVMVVREEAESDARRDQTIDAPRIRTR